MRSSLLALTAAAAMLGVNGGAGAQTLTDPPTLTATEVRQIAKRLQLGGYVLYFRHLATRQDQEDSQPVDLSDCTRQRNLSHEGIAQGRAISQAFLKLRIPLGEVISSPFCRTLDTAKLIAGKASANPDLFFAISLTAAEKERKATALRALLARAPSGQRNLMIVGHTANLQEAVGLWPKPEGVAYIFRPDGKGNISPVARIEPATWSEALR